MKRKTMTNLIAVMLAVITAFYALPVSAFESTHVDTELSLSENTSLDYPESLQENSSAVNVYVLGEDESKRTETAKHLRMSDGSFTVIDFLTPIHYQDKTGKWKDYDNSLSLTPATNQDTLAGYQSNNELNVRFGANTASEKLVRLSDGEYTIGLSAVQSTDTSVKAAIGSSKLPTSVQLSPKRLRTETDKTKIDYYKELPNLVSKATYANVFHNADIEYILKASKLKENIIIKTAANSYEYSFNLYTDGLTPVMCDDGSIDLLNTEDEALFTIPAGYMYDSADEYSSDVSYVLTPAGNDKYLLKVVADADWVNDSKRVFPVTVDPTLSYKAHGSDVIKDTYVKMGAPTQNMGDYAYMKIGYSEASEASEMRGLIGITGLADLPRSSVITSAELQLSRITSSSYNVGQTTSKLIVTARAFDEEWAADTATWNSVFGSDFTLSDEVIDYEVIDYSNLQSNYSFDLTSTVRDWYTREDNPDANKNYGIVLKAEVPSGESLSSATYFAFDTVNNNNGTHANYPLLVVRYRCNKGLEDIWTYHEASLGESGTGYINDYSGNLVYVYDDISTNGSILPINVSHVFNTYQSNLYFIPDEDNINAPITSAFTTNSGYGWKLSVQETIVPVTIDGHVYLVYNDADGTELYFYNYGSGSTYLSEDGYALTITKNTSSSSAYYVLKDDYDNIKNFNSSGLITSIQDVLGNKKNYVYSGTKLTSITYTPAGSSIEKTQLTFSYNTLGALSRITNGYRTSEYIDYYYSGGGFDSFESATTSSSGYLKRIVHSNGKETNFHYNSDGTIYKAIDKDTQKVICAYYKSSYAGVGTPTKRVDWIREQASGNNFGQRLGFTYTDLGTTVRSSGQDDVYNTDDDILTKYAFDYEGRTFNVYTTDLNNTAIYGVGTVEYNNKETTTQSTLRKQNTITKDYSGGTPAMNLISNPGFESTGAWTYSFGANQNIEIVDTESYLGNRSLKFTSDKSSTNMSATQVVSIPEAGTYTLSAYIKTEIYHTCLRASVMLGNKESEIIINRSTNDEYDNGWQRVSVTQTFESAGNQNVTLRLYDAYGLAYFDCVQLEKSNGASSYNILNDGDFEDQTNWTTSYGGSFVDSDSIHGKVVKVNSAYTTTRYSSQNNYLNVGLDTNFVLSGWGKASSVKTGTNNAVGSNRTFRLVAKFYYSDGTTEEHAADFEPDYKDWQFTSEPICLKKSQEDYPTLSITRVLVFLSYDYNANTAYFDNVSLTIEPVREYAYDSEGKMVSLSDTLGNTEAITYSGKDVSSYTDVLGTQYDYTYKTVNGVNTHLVSSAVQTSSNGTITTNYTYDSYGNVTGTTVTAAGSNYSINESASYTNYGNYLSSVTDSRGKTTNYSYNTATDLLKFVEDANSNRTAYIYDDRDRVTSVYIDSDEDGVKDTSEAAVDYTYENNNLTGISTATTDYTLNYDVFYNLSSIDVGDDYTIASYTYGPQNGKLLKTTYGNGFYVENVYDNLDRISEIKYNGEVKFRFAYNSEGRLTRHQDLVNGHVTKYTYDGYGRLINSSLMNSSEDAVQFRAENLYDSYGRVDTVNYYSGQNILSYTITYKGNTSLVESVSLPSGASIDYTYDKFNRLTEEDNGPLSASYTYLINSANATTSALVGSYDFVYNGGSSSDSYSFTYDNNGNICIIKKNGTRIWEYEYDKQNRLTLERNCIAGTFCFYTYDNAGNITSVKVKDSNLIDVIAEETYAYTDSSWGDLLTNYNGTVITYDGAGNPNKWRGGALLGWQNGRELTAYTKSELFARYKYNADGIRTRRVVTDNITNITTTHTYRLDGTKIIRDCITYTGGAPFDEIFYYYDTNGAVVGFRYNGTSYYYGKNVQGDIIGIYDANGTELVRYEYSAYGEVLSVTGTQATTLGVLNPFRYRGYYYDTESGLYYVNSRYYDPKISRFISPDTTDVLTATPMGLTDKNLFAYCDNNPVMRADHGGDFWHIVVGAAVGALIGGVVKAVSNAIEGKSLTDGLATAMLAGAASGALASTGVGIVGMVAGNAAISMAENAANQVIENKGFNNFDVGDMLIDGAIGGVSGALGGAGKGTKHLTNLGKQTVKRTFNATTNKGLRAGLKEAGKAFAYYGKNSDKYYKTFVKGLPSDFISTVGTTIASSNYMKYQYRRIFVR